MIFAYLPLPTKAAVPSLGGARVRYRPIVPVRIFGPLGSRLVDGCLDSGSDDTIFPLSLATKLGIDLRGASQGMAQPVGGLKIPYTYAAVKLRIGDAAEVCEWQSMIGFLDRPMRWALLGHAGFLEYFDTELRGERRESRLTANTRFPGAFTRLKPAIP